MTADDLLFSPINAPVKSTANASTTTGGIGIIIAPDQYMRVDIQRAHPLSYYEDAADKVMDDAIAQHQGVLDVRINAHLLPHGFLTLRDIVGRFHNGEKTFYTARPGVMPPKRFEFEGRFGYFKFYRLPDANNSQQTMFWFWIDSNEGQMAAIDLGVLCAHPKFQMYHLFADQTGADNYYRS